MKLIAALLLTLIAVQDKPVSSEPAKQAEPKTAPTAPAKPPVILPTARTMQGKPRTNQPLTMETFRPTTAQKVISAEELKQLAEVQPSQTIAVKAGIVFQNGALYTQIGGVLYPVSGGGASGCFGTTPERNEQIQKEARLQFEKEKADAEKKK